MHPIGLRPSILLLEAAQGGVLNNSEVAKRWAQLVLKSNGTSFHQPLEICDDGDGWSVTVVDRQPPTRFRIRKRDAAVLSPDIKHDILPSRPSVERFASLIIANASSEAALERQLPLLIEDKGETWLLSGKRDSREGPGPCHIEVRKKNGQVLDMWFEWLMTAPTEN